MLLLGKRFLFFYHWVKCAKSQMIYQSDRSHSVPAESIGDWLIFVYMNEF